MAFLAFGLLALVGELVGRSLTGRIDVGRHVAAPGYADASYYPFLLLAVKGSVALLLARLAWRFAKAHATERAARRVASALGIRHERRAPRVRIELSPGLWLISFVVTAGFYLVHADAEQLAQGRFAPFGPWLHSSALPVFAVLAVVMAVVYRAVARWLSDYEAYARETADFVRSAALRAAAPSQPYYVRTDAVPPRRLHGVVFESRPPPAPA